MVLVHEGGCRRRRFVFVDGGGEGRGSALSRLTSGLVSACERGYQRRPVHVDDWESRIAVLLVVSDGLVVLPAFPAVDAVMVAALFSGSAEVHAIFGDQDFGADPGCCCHVLEVVPSCICDEIVQVLATAAERRGWI